jgi:hypothetical protein
LVSEFQPQVASMEAEGWGRVEYRVETSGMIILSI